MLLLEWLFGDPFITHFALVPLDILHGQNLITLLTSMFLHKGLLQLSGKMRYLRIFGPNLEDVTARSALWFSTLRAVLCQGGPDPH